MKKLTRKQLKKHEKVKDNIKRIKNLNKENKSS